MHATAALEMIYSFSDQDWCYVSLKTYDMLVTTAVDMLYLAELNSCLPLTVFA